MADMKDDIDKHDNEDVFSDYEDLLSGLAIDDDDNSDTGKSEDRELLSELLEGVDAQDDRENHDADAGMNLNNSENSSLDDSESVTSGSSDDKPLKTNSGKFEIEVDDENVDYASILSEIESAGAPSEETGVVEEPAEEEPVAIELDIVGGGEEDAVEETDIESITVDTEPEQENKLEDELLREFLQEMEEKDAAEEAEEALAMETGGDIGETSEQSDTTDELIIENSDDTGALETLAELTELDIESLQEEKETGEPAAPTGEYAAMVEEEQESAFVAQDVSYTSFLSEDDQKEEAENVIDIGPDSDSTETGEYVLAADEDDTPVDGVPSYASFIEDDEIAGGDMSNRDTGEHEGTYVAMENEDYSLDETDLDLTLDDTDFSLTDDVLTDNTAEEEMPLADDGIVVDGGSLTEAGEEEEDFLGLEDSSTPDDDSFLGVSDVKEEKLPEVILDGIEMDTTAQTAAVTRAELYLAQGRREEASAVYAQIAEERGISPFVAKRLKQLGLDRPETQREAEELADQ